MRKCNCIFTVCIGKSFEKLSKYTLETISEYAKRIGCDFFILKVPYLEGLDFEWSKFYVNELLKKYDRVLVIDADILVNLKAPNIFEHVSSDLLGICVDRGLGINAKFTEYIGRYNAAYLRKLDGTTCVNYFNSGVVLCNIDTNPFVFPENMEFKLRSEVFKEQHYVNAVIIERSLPVHVLENKWNFLVALTESNGYDIDSNYFLHYASKKCKSWVERDYLKIIGRER